VLGAVLAYVGTIVADTNDNLPTGLLDGAYVMRCVSDAAGNVAGGLLNAADDLAAGRKADKHLGISGRPRSHRVDMDRRGRVDGRVSDGPDPSEDSPVG
jgi:hypothetical protein